MATLSAPTPSGPPLSAAEAPRRTGVWPWVLGGLASVLVIGLLYSHRPAGQFFYPRCSFHTLSGLWCPGCGGLRSVHELLHGHWLEAMRCNALFVLGTPAALAWWSWRKWRGRVTVVTPRMVWMGFLVVALFTVLRNLRGVPFEWLAPVP